jgi:hypothetical protein
MCQAGSGGWHRPTGVIFSALLKDMPMVSTGSAVSMDARANAVCFTPGNRERERLFLEEQRRLIQEELVYINKRLKELSNCLE